LACGLALWAAMSPRSFLSNSSSLFSGFFTNASALVLLELSKRKRIQLVPLVLFRICYKEPYRCDQFYL
jgi:hypothetical protein